MVDSNSLPPSAEDKKVVTNAKPEANYTSAPGNVTDGQVVGPLGIPLHPQPTTDKLDPLNWTSTRKHIILGVVMYMYFMFTYITYVSIFHHVSSF